jgi:hypothetical protein
MWVHRIPIKSYLKHTKGKFVFCILLLSFASIATNGQSDSVFCSGMNDIDMSPAAINDTHVHSAGTWMLTYHYMNIKMDHTFSGSSMISDEHVFEKYIMSPQNIRMNMHMIMAMYGITNKFSIMLMLEYVSMSMSMQMLAAQMNMPGMNQTMSTMSNSSQGLADTKLNGLYSIFSSKNQTLLAEMGVSIPTGSINKQNMTFDSKLGYMMQTSSGTFNFLPTLAYVFHHNSYALGLQASSTIYPYFNKSGYKLANEWAINGWAAYQWFQTFSMSLRLHTKTSGSIKGQDALMVAPLEPDNDTQNYGGTSVLGYVGMAYYFDHNKIAAEYGIPLFHTYNGIQSAEQSNLYITWGVTF